jgi:hypothetical protein
MHPVMMMYDFIFSILCHFRTQRQLSPAGRGITCQLGAVAQCWSYLRKTRVLASPVHKNVSGFFLSG